MEYKELETVEITVTYDGPANRYGQMIDSDGSPVLNPRKVKYQATGNPKDLVQRCHEALHLQGLVRMDPEEETPWMVMISVVHKVRRFEWWIEAARVLRVSRSMKYEEVHTVIQKAIASLTDWKLG